MIRVIVADDHPLLRDGLRRLMEPHQDLKVVAEAGDGAELLDRLAEYPADVLVLDLSLPHLRGLPLVSTVVERYPTLRILIYSVQPEDRLTLHLFEAGVRGYLCKDRGASEILAAIRAVARGQRHMSEGLRRLADTEPNVGPPHDRFSVREVEVFQLLLRGLSVSDISDELEIQASTVSNHMARIREKLGVETNGEVMLYAFRAGLVG